MRIARAHSSLLSGESKFFRVSNRQAFNEHRIYDLLSFSIRSLMCILCIELIRAVVFSTRFGTEGGGSVVQVCITSGILKCLLKPRFFQRFYLGKIVPR